MRLQTISRRGLKGIRALQRKYYTRTGMVLMYHRITQPSFDPWSLSVSVENFAAHMEVIRKHYNPITLEQLVEDNYSGKLPDNAVAITFDDGYEDNLDAALPILEKYEIPFTVFVVADCIDREEGFWWDELESLIITPEEISLESVRTITDEEVVDIGETQLTKEEYSDNEDVYRKEIYMHVWNSMFGVDQNTREKMMAALREQVVQLNPQQEIPHSKYRTLSSSKLQQMSDSELATIGSHTISHPRLNLLSDSEQRREIVHGTYKLETLLKRKIDFFSYPFGNYDEKSIRIVREAGIAAAVSTTSGLVWRKSNRYRLPRLAVVNQSAKAFSSFLLASDK